MTWTTRRGGGYLFILDGVGGHGVFNYFSKFFVLIFILILVSYFSGNFRKPAPEQVWKKEQEKK